MAVPSKSRPIAVAFDIETAPLGEERLTTQQQERLEKDEAFHRRKSPDLSDRALRRKAQSLSPFLGYICCIAAVSWRPPSSPNEPVSWTARSPSGERELLDAFWNEVERFPAHTTWATFFGKGFDAPFLEARTLRWGLWPARRDLLDTYPYRMYPHADLAKLWPRLHYSLGDLCDLLEVSSPKCAPPAGDGAPVVSEGREVAAAMEQGHVGAVARYCEHDALATARCLQQVPRSLWKGN